VAVASGTRAAVVHWGVQARRAGRADAGGHRRRDESASLPFTTTRFTRVNTESGGLPPLLGRIVGGGWLSPVPQPAIVLDPLRQRHARLAGWSAPGRVVRSPTLPL
jgi:hypothetical protein